MAEQAAAAHPSELERLGESREWGRTMLRLLVAAGWTINEQPVFAGWTQITARRGDITVEALGETLADAAYQAFEQAMKLRLWRAR